MRRYIFYVFRQCVVGGLKMASHVWFVPAASGGQVFPITSKQNPLAPNANVQWQFGAFPPGLNPPVDIPCLAPDATTNFTVSAPGAAGLLDNCYATWAWKSHGCDNRITIGGELLVGTVFSRFLPTFLPPPFPGGPNVDPGVGSPYTWGVVEAWAKYRVSDQTKLSAIFFSLNGDINGVPAGLPVGIAGTPPADWLPFTAPGQWKMAYASMGPIWGAEWAYKNLRAVLTLQGATAPGVGGANVGNITVDVEYFAFRLSDGNDSANGDH
jgi:hypothetical protein